MQITNLGVVAVFIDDDNVKKLCQALHVFILVNKQEFWQLLPIFVLEEEQLRLLCASAHIWNLVCDFSLPDWYAQPMSPAGRVIAAKAEEDPRRQLTA